MIILYTILVVAILLGFVVFFDGEVYNALY